MPSPLYNQLQPQNSNNMLQQFLNFKKTFNGNPQQIIQNMINSGKITQAQVNQYAQQANDLYRQFKNFM